MEKTCRRCSKLKALSEYYPHKQMADGHLNICRECKLSEVKAYRSANLEKVRAYDRLRGRDPKRLAKVAERARRLYGGQYQKAVAARYKERHPEKRAARLILGNAVRDGRIRKLPCEVCGNVKSEGHHDDYAFPLRVRWLCRKHHAEIHRAYKD